MTRIMRYAIQDKKYFIGLTLFCLNVLLLGVIVRLPVVYFISHDYIFTFKSWYYIIAEEGFAAFEWGATAPNDRDFTTAATSFSVYNVPYLYLLSLAAVWTDWSGLVAIKLISIIFDFGLAFFVYKCVELKYKANSDDSPFPSFLLSPQHLALFVTLFAPFVILNSSVWGQNDSIYTALLVACLYALLRERQAWAFIAFGLSFSFKSQAMFLAPLFLWLLMKKQVKWRYFFLSLLVYLVTLLPAWFIGRPFGELLLTYFRQVGQYDRLSMDAPNLYEWIPNHYYRWYPLGIIFTILVVLAIALYVYKSRVDITSNVLVHLATFSTLIVPFFLPRMHERYFFPASIMAIIFAFYFPKYWYTAVVIGLVSTLAYLRYLYEVAPVPLPLLAVFTLLLVAVLAWKLMRTIEHQRPATDPAEEPGRAEQTPKGAG